MSLRCLKSSASQTEDDRFISVFLNPYEQEGMATELFGDLAIIVGVKSEDLGEFQGVAFLEAKREGRELYRFQPNQPEKYFENTGHHFLLYYEREATAPATCGLLHVLTQCRVFVVPTGVALANRHRRPALFSGALSSLLADRMFLGYELDVRPTAVNVAFAVGAQWYLHVQAGVARSLSLSRALARQVRRLEMVPPHIVDMWQTNERLQHLAVERGLEPPAIRMPKPTRGPRLR
jgi:hypothetical protein